MKRFSLLAAILIMMTAISASLAEIQSHDRERASISGHSGECTLCLRCLL